MAKDPRKGRKPINYTPEASFNRLFYDYKWNCKVKNTYFGLTKEQFRTLTKKNCYYCNRPPHQKRNAYTYTGIDRMDSSEGYYLKNCVPSCMECNFIKGKYLTPQETKAAARGLSEYRRRRGIPLTAPVNLARKRKK